MSVPKQTLINDALRRFDRLAGLDETQLNRIAEQAQVHEAASGSCVLELGDREPRQLFLLEGELELIAADGIAHCVRDTDKAAAGPVSRLRPSRYRVGARSDVRYLLLDEQLLDDLTTPKPTKTMVVEENLPVNTPNELLDDSATHPLLFDVFHDLNGGRIVVPSDPEIAVRIGRSLAANINNPSTMADALAACPALTLKILRAAKGVGPQRVPLRSLREAVIRLGNEHTYALAAHCVLRETLRCESPIVRQRVIEWGKRSRRVAAISRVLARQCEHFDPDFAHLVGLLHGIAEPVLLSYTEQHSDLGDPAALDNVIHGNRAELGRILLTMWDLPRAAVQAAALCGHWSYEHPGEADYTDILLVAEWHATIGSQYRRPPPHEEIPAFGRLGMRAASPELSLTIVEEAECALDRSDALLLAG